LPQEPPPPGRPDDDPLATSADLAASDLPSPAPPGAEPPRGEVRRAAGPPGDRGRRPAQAARARESLTLLAVASGGALGALTRYEVALAVPAASDGFPFSTLLINLSGAAFLGFLLTVVTERRPPTRYIRPLLGTGFAGGFTTWSTFMVDTDLLVHHHHPVVAAGYAVATVVGGLGVLAASVRATRRLPPSRLTPGPRPGVPG
jgi:CrcB protein